jgi:hypothetical protein
MFPEIAVLRGDEAAQVVVGGKDQIARCILVQKILAQGLV